MNVFDHNTGIEITDLEGNLEFQSRPVNERLSHLHLNVLQRLVQVFVLQPEQVLQELVEVAISLCGADSAGVSLETTDAGGQPVYHWVATSGQYARFMQAKLPKFWMPCSVCLDRMRPQMVRVPRSHFEAMGNDAEPITDGLLIPWETTGVRGTIWILAHGRQAAFSGGELRLMETLANLAMAAVRNQQQQQELQRQRSVKAAAAMAHDLAHQINNPLQSVTNSLFLAHQGNNDNQPYVEQAATDLKVLSKLVGQLLDVSADQVSGDASNAEPAVIAP